MRDDAVLRRALPLGQGLGREQPLDFYQLDVLPATQPTVSKHYRKTRWFGHLLFFEPHVQPTDMSVKQMTTKPLGFPVMQCNKNIIVNMSKKFIAVHVKVVTCCRLNSDLYKHFDLVTCRFMIDYHICQHNFYANQTVCTVC